MALMFGAFIATPPHFFPPVQAEDRRQAENALRGAAKLALRAQTVAGPASHSQPVASENWSLAQHVFFILHLSYMINQVWQLMDVSHMPKVRKE